jgi:ABC-type lipoprotein release transport system permease subunit
MAFLTYSPIFVGVRYLLKKKLSYLAALGVALSVGTLIVVLSVFTGFHLRMTAAIRGYLSDLTIRPMTGRIYGMDDWHGWAETVRATEHVTGVAPFVHGFGLVRLPGTDMMTHVFFRGVDPDLEGQVSEMPRYMKVGKLADLRKTYPDTSRSEGGSIRAAFVGKEFPGFSPDLRVFDYKHLDTRPGRLILITATADLDRRVTMFAVNGQFETGYFDYDSQFVVLDLQSAMDFVGSGGAVSGLNVKLDDFDNAEEARRLLLQRMAPGAELRTFGAPAGTVVQVAASDDGTVVAALLADGTIQTWDGVTGRGTGSRTAAGPKPTTIALGPQGDLLLVGREDGSIALEDLSSEEGNIGSVPAASPVTAVAVAPDGYLLAAGREDGSAAVWDVGSGEPSAQLGRHEGAVRAVAFDGFSERVATASDDGTADVWDVETGRRLVSVGTQGGPAVLTAAFSQDRKQLATGDAVGRLILWNVEDGSPVGGWPAQRGGVRAVAYGSSADTLLTAGADGASVWRVILGDAMSSGLLAEVDEEEASGGPATFQANGRHMLAVGADGLLRRLYVGPRFSVKTWQEEQLTLLEAVAMERFLMALILSLILVVALFFVFALVTTMVSERRRDIGILKGIGFTRGQIGAVFLIIGLAIGVGGSAIGIAAGLLFSEHINGVSAIVEKLTGFNPFPPTVYYFTEIPHYVEPMSVVFTAAGAILGSLFFSIFPALRAARLDPVRTLHYE